jgi:hypothetical protein
MSKPNKSWERFMAALHAPTTLGLTKEEAAALLQKWEARKAAWEKALREEAAKMDAGKERL